MDVIRSKKIDFDDYEELEAEFIELIGDPDQEDGEEKEEMATKKTKMKKGE